jgi:NAD(P)-dependent dehydrogenase (short-subunit alcohol dehydrogenase family)
MTNSSEAFMGQVVVVTGASRGIGAAIAQRLAAAGARVAAVAEVAPAAGSGIVPFACDLADARACRRLLPDVCEQLGDVDVLINNAGVAALTPVIGLPDDVYAHILAVNLHAPVRLIAEAAERMAQRGFGRIVNVTSIHGRYGEVGSLAYDIAKAGLEQATRTAAIELAPAGILINAVAPGFVDTAMSIVDGGNELESERFRSIYVDAGRLPLRRAAQPDEVARHVLWLASSANTYLTGQVVTVDGGLTATF